MKTPDNVEKTGQKQSLFTRQSAQFEKSRIAAMAALLMIQSCIGSIVAMYLLKENSYIMLAVCIALTMGSNGAFIAQSPARWCLALFYVSVIVNLGMAVINMAV